MSSILPTSHLNYGFMEATFGVDAAAELWFRILGYDASHLCPVHNNVNAKIKLRLDQCPAPSEASIENATWVVDYLPNKQDYMIVPQTLYVPYERDGTPAKREKQYANLGTPLFFVNKHDVPLWHLGVNVGHAACGNGLGDLVDADKPLESERFKVQKATMSLRWKGLSAIEDQILFWDYRGPNKYTTIGRLAKSVASWLVRHLQANNIQVHPSNLRLVGMVQVSKGHWQPILYWNGAT